MNRSSSVLLLKIEYCMKNLLIYLALVATLSACSQSPSSHQKITLPAMNTSSDTLEIATFGAGCFWCVEAVYQQVNGVIKVESGYAGGQVKNPSYKEVCTGRTGHAEVCQITFDPRIVNYNQLLEVFFGTHDPTTLNRQGGDVGTQYRSSIMYHNDAQKNAAEIAIQAANASGNWNDPVVTEVVPFDTFYRAEDYHMDYFNLHGEQPYCQMVVRPKVEKFKKTFSEYLKK
jgi:peptide-methionine (S)-S-oxide reductase